MNYTRILWMCIMAVSYIGTTAEARVRKTKMQKDGVQNQQAQYEYENGDYDNGDGDYPYTDYDDKQTCKDILCRVLCYTIC